MFWCIQFSTYTSPSNDPKYQRIKTWAPVVTVGVQQAFVRLKVNVKSVYGKKCVITTICPHRTLSPLPNILSRHLRRNRWTCSFIIFTLIKSDLTTEENIQSLHAQSTFLGMSCYTIVIVCCSSIVHILLKFHYHPSPQDPTLIVSCVTSTSFRVSGILLSLIMHYVRLVSNDIMFIKSGESL